MVGGGMNTAMNIAVSGMRAASTGFAASASNLANLESDGPVPAISPQQPVASAPGRVSQPLANMQGMIAEPDADPAQQVVNLMTASLAYRANIVSFKTAQQMEKTLLDATA
jgi:flagellar basal body rod protein FlgC